MKIKYTLATVLVIAILAAANLSLAQGVQKIRITGMEVLYGTPPAPNWTSFSTKQTLAIPSLQVEEYILYMDSTSPGNDPLEHDPFGAFKGYGTAVLSDAKGDQIGDATFFYVGENFSPPFTINYQGIITVVGTIWDGPLEGLVISETISMAGVVEIIVPPGYPTDPPYPTYPEYLAHIEGFLTAPEYIDFKALKASFKD